MITLFFLQVLDLEQYAQMLDPLADCDEPRDENPAKTAKTMSSEVIESVAASRVLFEGVTVPELQWYMVELQNVYLRLLLRGCVEGIGGSILEDWEMEKSLLAIINDRLTEQAK